LRGLRIRARHEGALREQRFGYGILIVLLLQRLSGGERRVFLLRFSEAAPGVAMQSLGERGGATSGLVAEDEPLEAVQPETAKQSGFGSHAEGLFEVEGVSGLPLLLNGEALCEGERRRLRPNDLVGLGAGGLELTVRESRGKGEEGQGSGAGAHNTVADAMACAICLATVLPASHRSAQSTFSRLLKRFNLGLC
jgi:hypothetical protein